MASDAIGHDAMGKEILQTAPEDRGKGEFHQDVEVGLEAIDIDRIERVYK